MTHSRIFIASSFVFVYLTSKKHKPFLQDHQRTFENCFFDYNKDFYFA